MRSVCIVLNQVFLGFPLLSLDGFVTSVSALCIGVVVGSRRMCPVVFMRLLLIILLHGVA